MESVEERGRVFDSSLIASFKPLDTLERVIAGVTPKQVRQESCLSLLFMTTPPSV